MKCRNYKRVDVLILVRIVMVCLVVVACSKDKATNSEAEISLRPWPGYYVGEEGIIRTYSFWDGEVHPSGVNGAERLRLTISGAINDTTFNVILHYNRLANDESYPEVFTRNNVPIASDSQLFDSFKDGNYIYEISLTRNPSQWMSGSIKRKTYTSEDSLFTQVNMTFIVE